MFFRTLSATTRFRIVLATWVVLLSVIPGTAPTADPTSAAPVSDSCRGCGEEEAPPCCSSEASLPCSSQNACPRCPLTGGSLVFLAPDGFGCQPPATQTLIRPDDPSLCNVYLTPPERPPQPSVHS